MYAREVDGQTLTLAVSGMLWNRSLVMRDVETGSLWSHLLGEAMQGPLKGKRLRQVPSLITDWQTWRERFPNSSVVVLSHISSHLRRGFHSGALQRYVLGVAERGTPLAWTLALLDHQRVVNDELAGRPVVAMYDSASTTARLFDRHFESQVLTFRHVDGTIQDVEMGSTWEPVTGKALSGPAAGKYLTPLPAIVSYRRAWLEFHPNSVIHERESDSQLGRPSKSLRSQLVPVLRSND